MSIDDRHRDKNGEISKKHGNTLIRTLRKIYGNTFAAGHPETAKLAEVLHHLNETSLSQLVHDQKKRAPRKENEKSRIARLRSAFDVSDLQGMVIRTMRGLLDVAGIPIRSIAEIMAWDEESVEKIIRRYVNRTALTKALIEQMNEAGTKTVKPAVKL
jgi:hypothetical protein